MKKGNILYRYCERGTHEELKIKNSNFLLTMNSCWISPSYFPQIKASILEPRTRIQPFSSKPDFPTEKIESFLPFNVKSITSTSNPFVKHCLKLRQNSSYRHFHGSVLVVGSTPIR